MRNLQDVVATEQVGPIDPGLLLSGQEQPVTVILNPVNVRRDAIEWGAGGDGFVGDTFVLVQVNQTAVLAQRREPVHQRHRDPLLDDAAPEASSTIGCARSCSALYGMQGVYGVAHPRLTYSISDHFDVRVGFVAIAGHEESVVGQYHRNDEGYVRVRFLF